MKQKIVTALLTCILQLSIFHGVQAFPDRPVKLVVSSPPGGPPDIMARLLTDKMAAALGQPVISENRAGGAGGLIAAKSVIAAEPDGYTVMMGSTSTLLTAPLIYKNAGYTAQTFTTVAGVSETAEILAVHPSVAAHTVAELVSLAKRLAALSLEIPSLDQQTPEGLYAHQKAEIEKWWPIIKGANLKGE